MMKRCVCFIAFAIVLFGLVGAAQAVEGIVFVDMEKVFNEYDKTQMADSQLKKQAKKFSEERQEMIAEVEELREQFNTLRQEARDEALSEEAREEKKKEAEDTLVELRKKEDEIKEFNKLRSKQLEDQGKRMRESIVEEIANTISKYARNEGYRAVVDSSAKSMNAIDSVMYVDSRYDVTDEVIGLLNQTE